MRVALTLEQCWHRVPGGTAVAAIRSAGALADRSDIDIVGVAALHARAPDAAWTPPVPVRHLPLPRPALYEAWHRIRRPRVERATGAIDLIHATSFAIPPRSVPLVVTIHDLAFLAYPQHFTKRGLSFFHTGLELAKDVADVVVCPSRSTLESCAEAGFARDRLRVVPLAADTHRARQEEIRRVRRAYRLGRDYVLWTGTVEPRKNLRALIEAWQGVGVGLDLVLVGPRGWQEDLRPLLAATDRVKPLGFVPVADLAPLYAGARAFCYPSLMEGFGLPVLEAMAQGTPVVTSRGTATEEIAAGTSILVDPRHPSSIAAGLERVIEDEALAERLGQAGAERARGYSWDQTAARLIEIYREVRALR